MRSPHTSTTIKAVALEKARFRRKLRIKFLIEPVLFTLTYVHPSPGSTAYYLCETEIIWRVLFNSYKNYKHCHVSTMWLEFESNNSNSGSQSQTGNKSNTEP